MGQVLADRGVPPGQVLLGGFDLVPEVLDRAPLASMVRFQKRVLPLPRMLLRAVEPSVTVPPVAA